MTPHVLSRTAQRAALLAVALLAQACTTPPPSVAPTQAAPGGAAAGHPYQGVFVSGCQPLVDGLAFLDRIELTPRGRDVAVQYRKVFFTDKQCRADTLLVTYNLPISHWTIGEPVLLNGKTGHRISTVTEPGKLTATPAQLDAITETPDAFVMRYGDGKQLPVEKATEGARTKELRLVDQGRLYVSNQETASDEAFPETVDFDNFYERP